MRIAILQHVDFEGPGALESWLQQHGHSVWSCRLDAGDALPEVNQLEGLVVLGGPMGVHDNALYPWLEPERQLLAEAMERDLPVLGLCLGAQQMAAALGAQVAPGPEREIGWWPLKVSSPELPIASGQEVFHWHGDRFELPPGCEPMASTPLCPHQAFRRGRALGLQFHLETTPAVLEALIAHSTAELEEGGLWVQSLEALRERAPERCHQLHQLMDRVLERWLNA